MGILIVILLLCFPCYRSGEESLHGRKAGGTSTGRADLQKVNNSKAATPGGLQHDVIARNPWKAHFLLQRGKKEEIR